MKMDLVTMSTKELEQLALMRRIVERRTTQREMAEQLGVSLRQVERVYAVYKATGAWAYLERRSLPCADRPAGTCTAGPAAARYRTMRWT
jgi:transcriptional regulator GlxA family with amidase domain